MTLERLVIVGLVVWRISSLLVNEDGPFNLFAKFRHKIGVYYDEYSVAHGRNVIAGAFTCVWCISFWVAWICAPLVFIDKSANILEYILATLALNAIGIVINEVIFRLTSKT